MCAFIKFAAVFAGLSLLAPAGVAAPALASGFFVRALYDDNVFLQDHAPLAPGQTTAALPARAGAGLLDLGATLGLTWQPGPALKLDAGYAPEVFRYSRFQTENHTDHRLTLGVAGAADGWTYEAKGSWLATVGSHDSPVFNRLGGSPPIGSEPVRARRAQDIFKASGRVSRAGPRGFVRGGFAIIRQDFHTRESTAFGCANYVDRGEWSAGAEAGWKVTPDLAFVAAVRPGRQHQADLLGVPLNYTNTLTRWLVGAEGRLTPAGRFSFLLGPDVRRFGPSVRPGFNRHQTTTYAEANATWSPTKADTLSVSGRRYLWVGSGGRGVYVDSLYDLNWKHQFAPAWSLGLGLNEHTGLTGRFNSAAPRHDVVRAVTGTLTHVLDARTRLELGVAQDRAASQVPNTPGREYHRWIYNLGCSRIW